MPEHLTFPLWQNMHANAPPCSNMHFFPFLLHDSHGTLAGIALTTLNLQHSREEQIQGTGIAEDTTNDNVSANASGQSMTQPKSRSHGCSWSRKAKVKTSAELVQESDDEMEEIPVVKAKDKGKRKATEEDKDYMEVDEVEEPPLPIQPKVCQGGVQAMSHSMVKHSSSCPPIGDPMAWAGMVEWNKIAGNID